MNMRKLTRVVSVPFLIEAMLPVWVSGLAPTTRNVLPRCLQPIPSQDTLVAYWFTLVRHVKRLKTKLTQVTLAPTKSVSASQHARRASACHQTHIRSSALTARTVTPVSIALVSCAKKC